MKQYNNVLQEVKLIDPSMGSGHILVYAFEVFLQLYEAEGESTRTAVEFILQKNLFGLDIDKRAFQLAYFALMMKGRQYNRRLLTKNPQPNLYQIPDNFGISESELQLVHFNFLNQEKGQTDLTLILNAFKMSPDLGSLISFEEIDFENLKSGMSKKTISFYDEELKQIIQVAELLQIKYMIAITNPPYMGASGMNKELATFVKKEYSASKSDLFAVFIERLKKLLDPLGYYAMITQHAWMFLSSFEKLRLKVNQQTIINMVHLGTRAFEEIGGEVVQTTAFVMSPIKHSNYVGSYLRLVDFPNHTEKEKKTYEAIQYGKSEYLFSALQDNFTKIPGMPISYWVSEKLIHNFVVGKRMDEIVNPKVGLQTGSNDNFIRYWWEVDQQKIKYDAASIEDSIRSQKKWFPYNKGGSFRRWYGNYDYVVNWENDGQEIRNFVDDKGNQRSVIRNPSFYFKEAITWSDITSGDFSMRYREFGSIFDSTGHSAFSDSIIDKLYLLGLLNTPVGNYIFKILNPTIHMHIGYVSLFPTLSNIGDNEQINNNVKQNIDICKKEWMNGETGWVDFERHPLI